ncbi:Uu.00g065490.m01.CDS01 [Anthostomella pinea]|uniref:Uu.00g065490.m01.CDS01 n=1 Tax=Anthostomella pinea TaxID=933095 RepID=A0AAI8YN30_9PEZI|nr:Uu.00g065490.m01.CDS01 [Anthostomella pinea]
MLGRALLTIDALGLLFGAPMADLSHTHMYNPNWPPHAKFHNGQTITLSVLLGIATMYYTWRRPATRSMKREFMLVNAFTGSIYWLAGLAAILFPGTMGLDPEFGGPGFPQAWLFIGFATCGLVGSFLEA